MEFNHKNLIQRSFVENYVDVPQEAREELDAVYELAESAAVNALTLDRITTVITKGGGSDDVVEKVRDLLRERESYIEVQNLLEGGWPKR